MGLDDYSVIFTSSGSLSSTLAYRTHQCESKRLTGLLQVMGWCFSSLVLPGNKVGCFINSS